MNASELTFGIEIETTMPVNSTPVGPHGRGVQVPWLPEGWLADSDPSIRASRGRMAVEFVSPVLKGAEGLQQLIDAVQLIVRNGGRVNASCGLHVHVGFNRQDRVTLQKLMTLVSNHEKAIYASTGTKSRETGRWCAGLRRYGQFDNAVARANTSRYHVMNITSNKPTVEFRAFSATLNIVKVVGYVRLCLGLVERAHNAKRVTKWIAKTPVETSPIHRSGEGQTEIVRLFYTLGWTKGRTPYVYGDVSSASAPTHRKVKKELMRLAKKYDGPNS